MKAGGFPESVLLIQPMFAYLLLSESTASHHSRVRLDFNHVCSSRESGAVEGVSGSNSSFKHFKNVLQAVKCYVLLNREPPIAVHINGPIANQA